MVISSKSASTVHLRVPTARATPRAAAEVAPRIELDRALCTNVAEAVNREWLVTNGIGGYAAGTISGAATRRYHGLLVAALAPPLGRTLLVGGLDARAEYLGRTYALSTHEYGGAVHPEGYRHAESFALDDGRPVWTYVVGDARLTQSVWMGHEANTTYIRFQLDAAAGTLRLTLAPLCSYRDYHSHSHGGWSLGSDPVKDGVEITAFPGARPYRLLCAGATFQPRGDWYWNFRHRVEAERGLDDGEDLYCPGEFRIELEPGEAATLILSAEFAIEEPGAALADSRRRSTELRAAFSREPGWIRQLVLAADQFVVRRGAAPADGSGSGSGEEGATVIAGYPWFGDWGRDTMIALPGLTLTTGRAEIAARVLRTFAAHISDGMLPNRFPDGGEAPEYNTVDATLWYFHTIDAYYRATSDRQLLQDLWPQLTDIIEWHLRGTRHGIVVDPADGLLRAGEPGVQLTWMDAKVGDWVVTPRTGKPVEINALWHHALVLMGDFACILKDTSAAARYRSLADGVRTAFRKRFWYAEGGYLYDVVDVPGDAPSDDRALRPNQIFAVSLPSPLLDVAQARSVVDVCQRELWTPMGLRSLAASDPAYIGTYQGGPRERDGAYHQGTVWSWLLGPFALAHFSVHGKRAEARALLAGIGSHLAEGCVGTVSEIFDGDAPFRPRGCFAQAWSVAEVLRAWIELGEGK